MLFGQPPDSPSVPLMVFADTLVKLHLEHSPFLRWSRRLETPVTVRVGRFRGGANSSIETALSGASLMIEPSLMFLRLLASKRFILMSMSFTAYVGLRRRLSRGKTGNSDRVTTNDVASSGAAGYVDCAT